MIFSFRSIGPAGMPYYIFNVDAPELVCPYTIGIAILVMYWP